MANTTKIPILGQDKSIIVGNGGWPHAIIENLFEDVPSSTYLLVTDTNLYPIYGPSFEQAFLGITAKSKSGAKLLTYQIAPGEMSKSRSTVAEIQDWMLDARRDPPLDTKSVIVALGGGVVGDMLGFVASTFKRGMRFVNVPTSLLAMVDSSIGGKTAIDTPVTLPFEVDTNGCILKKLISKGRPVRILLELFTSRAKSTSTCISSIAYLLVSLSMVWQKL